MASCQYIFILKSWKVGEQWRPGVHPHEHTDCPQTPPRTQTVSCWPAITHGGSLLGSCSEWHPTLLPTPDTQSDHEPERPPAPWLPTCTPGPRATGLQAPSECRQKNPRPLLVQSLGTHWLCACCYPRNLSPVLCLAPRTALTVLGRNTQAGAHPASRTRLTGKARGS